MRKLKGLIRLFRPDLSLAAGLCTFTGQVMAVGGLPPLLPGILAFLCVFCFSAAALILNDVFDYEVDCVNAPDRPLPSGAVTRREAVILTIVVSLVGLAAAIPLGLTVLILGAVLWVIGVLYNWRYKQSGLLGNLMVCVSVASTFVFGAASLGHLANPVVWTFSAMAFFLDLGEEIAADAMDAEGDKLRGSRSLALVKGRRFALRVSTALWCVVVLLSLLPYGMGWLGLAYLIIILLTDALLAFFVVTLLRSKDERVCRRAIRGIYLSMMLGIVAFVVGKLIG